MFIIKMKLGILIFFMIFLSKTILCENITATSLSPAQQTSTEFTSTSTVQFVVQQQQQSTTNQNTASSSSGQLQTIVTSPASLTTVPSSAASSSFVPLASLSNGLNGVAASTQTSTTVLLSSSSPAATSLTTSQDIIGVMNGNGGGVISDLPPHIETLTTIDEQIFGSVGPDQRESSGIYKALDWLKDKRSIDFGWGNDTHMVILSKELSGGRDLSPESDTHLQVISDLEDLLSIKQMEVEILTMLDHHHTLPTPVDSDRLARYVLALGSLCKDSRRFHGHDLVAALQHHEPSQDQEFALATLAACSSAAHVRKRQIRRLLDIASGTTDHSVDTIAMVILALRCIVTDHRHRHLQHFVRRPARGLASLQGPRGSFGSLRSTALAMQALQDLEPDPAGSWNRTAASKWILDRQRSDGGWTEEPLQDGQDPSIGIGLTADIILALGWKGLGAVRALQCDHVIRDINENLSENGESKLAAPVGLPSSIEESEAKNVSYTYTLWVGSNVTEAYSLTLISTKNTSFYRAMTQAAELDSRFAFEAREWPNGHYVHTLAGKKEEPRGYNYWLLYRLPELPDPNNPPGNQLIAPVGVDELLVEDGEHYLYWYKKL